MTNLVTLGDQSLAPFFTRAGESTIGTPVHSQIPHTFTCPFLSSDEGYGTGDTVGFLIKLPQSNGKCGYSDVAADQGCTRSDTDL